MLGGHRCPIAATPLVCQGLRAQFHRSEGFWGLATIAASRTPCLNLWGIRARTQVRNTTLPRPRFAKRRGRVRGGVPAQFSDRAEPG